MQIANDGIRSDVKVLFQTSAAIIWDIENINMPRDIKVSDVKKELLTLAANHYADVQSFTVIGSIRQFRGSLKLELVKNNIAFTNIISGKKNAADMSILYYIMKLKDSNPPPYKIILITGDSDFTELISQLRDAAYEVILVHLNESRKELIEAASHSISWTELLKTHLFIDGELFEKKRTISGSSINSNLSTSSDSTCNNADTCIVKFYTTGLFNYYSIPSNINVNVGDIVKVEDSINYINSWNIGKVVKIFYDSMINQTEFSIRKVVENKHFNLQLVEKQSLDAAVCEICHEFDKNIISAELRWDKQNITVYYIHGSDIDFTQLKLKLKQIYKISTLFKSIMICPKLKCINRYCKFHHA